MIYVLSLLSAIEKYTGYKDMRIWLFNGFAKKAVPTNYNCMETTFIRAVTVRKPTGKLIGKYIRSERSVDSTVESLALNGEVQ